MALAIADLTTCTLVIPGTIYIEYWHKWITSDLFCKIYYFLVTSTILYSALVMVAIAVDRYFCLCHPWKQAVTKSRAKVLVFLLACLSTIHGIVMACGNGVYQEYPQFESINCTQESIKHVLQEFEDMTSVILYICKSHWNTSNITFSDNLIENTCRENYLIINEPVQFYYKRGVMLIFGLCLLVVLVLYVTIYRSVTTRRVKRIRNRRLGTQPTLVVALPKHSISAGPEAFHTIKSEEAGIMAMPCEGQESINLTSFVTEKPPSRKAGVQSRPTALEVHVSENLKIAFMLFIVTIVFALSFLPAILILLDVIPHIPVVFYVYFVNNISNPVIYSFLNVNFRNKLKQLICRRAGTLRKNVCLF